MTIHTASSHPACQGQHFQHRLTQQDAWARVHRDAVRDYVFGYEYPDGYTSVTRYVEEFPFEQAILRMMESIQSYADAYANEYGEPDYVLIGDGLAEMVKGFRTLLNGPLGRLDGGTLDTWACELPWFATAEEEFKPNTAEAEANR